MSDLISRQAAIDAINEVYCHIEMIKKRPVNKTEQAIYLDMIGAVKLVPSAERKGHWEYLYDGSRKCSNCGSWWEFEYEPYEEGLNYCPNCGADMREKIIRKQQKFCKRCHFGKDLQRKNIQP